MGNVREMARLQRLIQPLPKSELGCGEDLVDGFVFKNFTVFNVWEVSCFEFVRDSAVVPLGGGIGGSGRGVWEVGGSICCLSSPPCPTPAHPPPCSSQLSLFTSPLSPPSSEVRVGGGPWTAAVAACLTARAVAPPPRRPAARPPASPVPSRAPRGTACGVGCFSRGDDAGRPVVPRPPAARPPAAPPPALRGTTGLLGAPRAPTGIAGSVEAVKLWEKVEEGLKRSKTLVFQAKLKSR